MFFKPNIFQTNFFKSWTKNVETCSIQHRIADNPRSWHCKPNCKMNTKERFLTYIPWVVFISVWRVAAFLYGQKKLYRTSQIACDYLIDIIFWIVQNKISHVISLGCKNAFFRVRFNSSSKLRKEFCLSYI